MKSLKEITENAFRNWNETIRRIKEQGIPINYSLLLTTGEYPAEFEDEAKVYIGGYVIQEGVLNSLKSTLGIREIPQILTLKADKIPQKSPKIEVKLREKDGGYELELADNGPGIKPENLERIWENRFSTFGTSGLGLGAMKYAVDQYCGRIKVESTPFVRTSFNIWIPSQS